MDAEPRVSLNAVQDAWLVVPLLLRFSSLRNLVDIALCASLESAED